MIAIKMSVRHFPAILTDYEQPSNAFLWMSLNPKSLEVGPGLVSRRELLGEKMVSALRPNGVRFGVVTVPLLPIHGSMERGALFGLVA